MHTNSSQSLVFFEALVTRGDLSARHLSITCLFFNGLFLSFSTTSPFFKIDRASNVNFAPSVSRARLCLGHHLFGFPTMRTDTLGARWRSNWSNCTIGNLNYLWMLISIAHITIIIIYFSTYINPYNTLWWYYGIATSYVTVNYIWIITAINNIGQERRKSIITSNERVDYL